MMRRFVFEPQTIRSRGGLFGIRNFGVDLTRLLPGGMSSSMHRHKQDKFVFILEGQPTLVTDQSEFELSPACELAFRLRVLHII
jgi:uncharacterized cupin superfamily protein